MFTLHQNVVFMIGCFFITQSNQLVTYAMCNHIGLIMDAMFWSNILNRKNDLFNDLKYLKMIFFKK
jgi:hypothetical protein